jgi:short subunit dehydrogenase-like uncharacterized protein
MQNNSFLLYGANGYTGVLIAQLAAHYNLQPILAGRREEALKPLAEKLKLTYRVIDLNDSVTLQQALNEVKVVVHAAGPFDDTAIPMIEACLLTGTHYLDINGDIAVFEMLKNYDDKGKQKGIMILPGAGFDVVPTDCTALFLKNRLPDAIALKLAFASLGGGLSHGTAITTANKLGEAGAVRKNGKIIQQPTGKNGMIVDFSPGAGAGGKNLFTVTIPWGDVFTAYHTTGIPDIEVYSAVPKPVYYLLKFQFLFNWLLRTGFIRNFIKKKINKRPAGPSDEKRGKGICLIWGQVKNKEGKTVTARLSGPEGYTLTAHSTLLITKKVLEGNFIAGYQTPASAYGEDLVMEIPGMKREVF